MLGAMQDSSIVFKMAAAIASQCRRLGVHIDFAPVIDVNNNPNNPVINFRSFGENKNKVANFGIQYMRGLQNNGVMACAKHFPGHGDTDVDSHKDTPEITKSLSDLEKLELYPFTKLIANGIQSIMVAHLQIPVLDSQAHTPSTLSEKTVTDLLKKKMGFMGLIFTDALNMEGVAKHFSPGDIDLKAFQAGNDVLLFSQDVPTGIQKIKNAIENAVHKPDVSSRSDMLIASMMGAIAFQKGLGVVHSLAHPLSSLLDTHHGLANAVNLPFGMEFNVPACEEKFRRIARTLELKEENGAAVVQWLKELNEKLGIPGKLSAIGVKEEHIDTLADLAFADFAHPNNPIPVSRDDFKLLYTKAF
jgi:hypothetical protein